MLADLADQGYREVVTSALAVAEQDPFRRAGFDVAERLHLLRHDLRSLPHVAPAPVRLRRARRVDRPRVLDVDRDAFSAFWRLDESGLLDALSATPTVRFRVAGRRAVVGAGDVQGYAVWGRAAALAYLQRLAVAPAHQHHGIGAALVVDGLAWARRRGVAQVLVNTQEHNAGALRLYEGLGFARQPEGLAVLTRSLTDDVGASRPA